MVSNWQNLHFVNLDLRSFYYLANGTVELVKESRIDILYPITGALVLVSSLGFLVMAIQSSVQKGGRNSKQHKKETQGQQEDKDQVQKTTAKLVAFVALMCIFFFLYWGAESVTGIYLTTFAVKSSLQTTKAEGAYVNAGWQIHSIKFVKAVFCSFFTRFPF